MRRFALMSTIALALAAPASSAQQPSTDGPYKVLNKARVGGEGGWDYIYAEVAGRRLYIPRGAVRAVPATDSSPERPAVPARIAVFNLDNLTPVGEILTAPNSNGNGVAVDPKSGHGFSSSRPQITMFDTKSLQLLKSIPMDSGVGPDGILFDAYNDRVYVFSHPTKDAMVIDAKDGTALGRIDLGGVPEQGVADGKGTLYVVMQDAEGSVTKVDVKTMTAVAHFPFKDKGGSCNGLALDAKNHILFAACGASGGLQPAQTSPNGQPMPQRQLPQPQMVILSADDGHIITTLPLAGGSDGAAFNPKTMEAFSSHGNGTLTIIKENSPTSFKVEQTVQTKSRAKTCTLDTKSNQIVLITTEPAPASASTTTPPAGGEQPGGRPGGGGPGLLDIIVVGR